MIGRCGARNFLLCKKPELKTSADDAVKEDVTLKVSAKGTGVWKSWINKSLKVAISAH
ncbi:hypothetical protein QQ045_017504 [Rhodiola kirilowii]